METFWWIFTLLLMLIGLAGTVLPLIPGTALILTAAVLHRITLGPEQSVGWVTLAALTVLMLLSQALELLSGSLGAKYFGATRWGAIGGILGGIIGIFFGLVGLIVGPLVGVLVGELLGGQQILPATRSTWGTLVGTTAGMLGKVLIALLMIGWFVVALLV
ncbi:MAG: DUF456 family protein [Verrucomicrobia bacterium]|nr:DUF456 family protein [Verrucomicrobiota bacterium]